jgi:putative heme iron utilization protein
VPTPTHAERARTLVQTLATGTLSTLAHDRSGHPYGSFVTFALDEGCPVLLISELAEHTRNLRADSRASLLVVEPGEGDPLARGRVTLVGQARILEPGEERQRAREAFLASHPNSSYYVDFKDFHLWTLEPDAIRYIGGYGRMSWIEAAAWSNARPDPIAPFAEGILTHMNADHADTIVAYCTALTRATDTTAAVMTGVDQYGFDMSATTGAGPRPIRLAFSREVGTSEQVREEMVALARQARRH